VWAVISGDEAIRRRPHERAAWLESKLVIFFMPQTKQWQKKSHWEKTWQFLPYWQDIVQIAERSAGPSAYVLPSRFTASGTPRFEQVR